MPPSIRKVEKLLNEHDFIIDAIFVYHQIIKFLRIISLKNGEYFLIHADSSYNLKVIENTRIIFNLTFIEFEPGDNLVEKYSDYPTGKQVDEKYNQEIKISADDNGDTENKLESKYNYKIHLKDVKSEKHKIIKSCFRQLKRLSLPFVSLRYKLCMLNEEFLCFTDDNDIINCYQIEEYKPQSLITIFIIVDLEYFFKKMANILDDVDTIKMSLYEIITKNHISNIENIKKMIDILTVPNDFTLELKKREIEESMHKCKTFLNEILTHEKKYIDAYEKLDESNIYERKKIEEKLDESVKLKKKILLFLVRLKEVKDNLYFVCDQIEFDNTILIDGVNDRIKDLRELKISIKF